MKTIKVYEICGDYAQMLSRDYTSKHYTTITEEGNTTTINDHGMYRLHRKPKFTSKEEAEKYVDKLFADILGKDDILVKLRSENCPDDVNQQILDYEGVDMQKQDSIRYYTFKEDEEKEEYNKYSSPWEYFIDQRFPAPISIFSSEVIIFEDGDVEKALLPKEIL